nr:MAG: internal scaffolding protein [Microvirus sp.]
MKKQDSSLTKFGQNENLRSTREIFSYSAIRPRHSSLNTEPSLTKQSFTAECDINNIIGQYTKSGVISHENPHNPQYGFAAGNDFREALEIVKIANDQFDSLPSNIRGKFNNSPDEFLDFAQNPNNAAEMVDMGLLDKSDSPVPKTDQMAPTEPTQASAPSVTSDTSSNAPDTRKT